MAVDDYLYKDDTLDDPQPRGLLSRWTQRDDAQDEIPSKSLGDETLEMPIDGDEPELDAEGLRATTREINQQLPAVLVVPETKHRIRLPDEGKLTLGCLNPFSGMSPDVDLTFDDQHHRSVAGFHAQIISREGEYYIEDLRSISGSWLNGERLLPRTLRKLTLGDEIRLGGCVLRLETAPMSWEQPDIEFFLYATATGQRFPLACPGEIVIGRADRNSEFVPDIDLTEAGEAALLVSRRHASIRCDDAGLFITDLGSTNRTKVDGVLVSTDKPMSLHLGQHIWLGGFGLVVDVVEGDTSPDPA